LPLFFRIATDVATCSNRFCSTCFPLTGATIRGTCRWPSPTLWQAC